MAEILTPESPRWKQFADALNSMESCDAVSHRNAKRIMAEMGDINIEATLAYFEDHGGYCDCEILMNVDPGFWGEPNEDYDKLAEAHLKEAVLQKAEFYNFGWVTDGDGEHDTILSKTSCGKLFTSRHRKTGEVEHHWGR